MNPVLARFSELQADGAGVMYIHCGAACSGIPGAGHLVIAVNLAGYGIFAGAVIVNPDDMETEIKAALADKGYPAPTNDAEMLSCIYHSLAERYKEVLDMLQEVAPFKIEKLHVIGGGSGHRHRQLNGAGQGS